MMRSFIIPWAVFLLLLTPAIIAARSNLHYSNFLAFLGLITLAAILIPASLLALGSRRDSNRPPEAPRD